ncbi:4,4'-diaponeurosporenoate glycosyltransferase [Rubripirellula obstinata]|uniref:4,4'-diaponeurosporenoate glycosyltransferase n=1 Tax=Rubripirellula obstinata TaxID=406547 RepID=A0A5B1CD09_9BACT|nr:glycosyltransferase [Rubripirellula obstinata]KAA1257845.1 4,4'-diaponeurosporenoate glycosyltransferase [Rubripirellula obstinata]
MMTLAVIGLVLAAIAAAGFLNNVSAFDQLCDGDVDTEVNEKVSVLIPARDEESGILASVSAALASEGVEVEVVVLDDHSTDNTAAIVQGLSSVMLSSGDDRLRYASSPELPSGWNGKQHACFQLSKLAKHDRLLFLDADVRLAPDAVARLVAYQNKHDARLLSAFPRQETGTWLEKLIIPMMHYVLLCYLPFSRMRKSTSAAYASGCGQLFCTRAADYQTAGTHQGIAASRHDGIKLPRLYRDAGLSTDVVDGSAIAVCRMYHGAREVVRGVLKNATEGIANVRLIIPFTILLVGGSVLPAAMAVVAVVAGRPGLLIVSAVGIVLGHLPRWIAAKRFQQSFLGVAFHWIAVAVFIVLQWIAFLQSIIGYQVAWRGRK